MGLKISVSSTIEAVMIPRLRLVLMYGLCSLLQPYFLFTCERVGPVCCSKFN